MFSACRSLPRDQEIHLVREGVAIPGQDFRIVASRYADEEAHHLATAVTNGPCLGPRKAWKRTEKAEADMVHCMGSAQQTRHQIMPILTTTPTAPQGREASKLLRRGR